MLIAVHEAVDEVPYVDGNFAAAQIIAQSYTLLHLERNPVVEKRKKSMFSIMFGVSETRRLRSKRRGNGRSLETTMASDEVSAVVEAR